MLDIDKQHDYLMRYQIDSVELGQLCEKYPGLKNSWTQFKLLYDLCKTQKLIDE